MQFKKWLMLTEAIDELVKGRLEKFNAPPEELRAFIKELEDSPEQIDAAKAFQLINQRFNVQKKEVKPKDEDAQLKHFESIPGITPEELDTYRFYKDENKTILKEMMELLRNLMSKNAIQIKIENGKPVLYHENQKIETPDFTRFMSALHGIRDNLKKYSHENKPNPKELEYSHPFVKGDNIWVFKGEHPDVCRILGKNQRWCIASASSSSNWFNYRINNGQTQYFIFDFNKGPDDPARYVNPGVGPEGGYSEWVDALNQPSQDPEDPKSQVGINGYRSINQYKQYLASKGIPLSTWTTTEPEKWEKRLQQYDQTGDFQGAKKDEDARVFPMYLKIVNKIKDKDFDSLNEEQKKEFVLGKFEDLPSHQLDYAIKNFKGQYYNSLDLEDKIRLAIKRKDDNLISVLIKNPELSEYDIGNLINYALYNDKYEIIKKIVDEKQNVSSSDVCELLRSAKDKDKIAEILGSKNIDNLDEHDLSDLLDDLREERRQYDKIAEIIIKYKKDISVNNIQELLIWATNLGNLEFVESLVKKLDDKGLSITDLDGKDQGDYHDPYSIHDLFNRAVKSGNLPLVEYLYKKTNREDNPIINQLTILYAALSGNLNLLKYIVSKAPEEYKEDALLRNYMDGLLEKKYGRDNKVNLEIVKYLVDENYFKPDYWRAFDALFNLGNLKIAKYLIGKLNKHSRDRFENDFSEKIQELEKRESPDK